MKHYEILMLLYSLKALLDARQYDSAIELINNIICIVETKKKNV